MYQMSVGLCSGTVTVTVAGLWQSCGCINIHKDPEAVHHVAVIH